MRKKDPFFNFLDSQINPMHYIDSYKEQKLEEFEKKFPELWSSNDGREGYDRRVESDVMDFLSKTIDELASGGNIETYFEKLN